MDFNVRQSFDFPTAYSYRRQIAENRNLQADLEYMKERKNILLEVRLICLDLVYTQTLIREYEIRSSRALELAEAYQEMFDKGETSILELNKARLNLLNIRQKLESLKIEQSTYQKQLVAMNGGKVVGVNISIGAGQEMPTDFDQWYTQTEPSIPELLWLDREVQSSQQQEKLNRAMSLPKASAGYMGEYRESEQLQGIMFGISVPLWENKNTVKYARLKTVAWQNITSDYKLQYYNQLKIQYEKALNLQNTVNEYKQSIGLYQNSDLLKIAFDKGEISLLYYVMELTLTYEVIDNYLQVVNEMNKAMAMLYQYQD
jgi:outer membrane protein TolC